MKNRMARRPWQARQHAAFDIRAEEGASEAEVLIYDIIGWPFIESRAFVAEINALEVETIHVRINSPGGNVFDGVAIANALKHHEARVITHIDALAASIASIIAIAGDEIRMSPNAFLMIHNPWTFCMGEAAQLRKDADVLDKIGESLAAAYRDRTGAADSQIKNWMDDETWFSAEEAAEHGFVDSIEGQSDAKAAFDLSVFAKAPAALVAGDERPEPTIRVTERALRDAGFSRSDAKAIAAMGHETLRQRDAAHGDEQAINDQVRSFLADMQRAVRAGV